MSTVSQPSTFGVRRRKRTENPSNHAQPWAWHTILIWDRPQLPATDYVGIKEFMWGSPRAELLTRGLCLFLLLPLPQG